jgi:hypothetical protein
MFRCEVCGSVSDPNTPVELIVVETRAVEYPLRPKVHWHPPRDGGKGKWSDDPGGRGVETVREVRACAVCAVRLREPRPPPARVAA